MDSRDPLVHSPNMLKSFSRSLLVFALLTASRALAHTPGEEMADAATRLMASLDDAQKAKLNFESNSDERLNWHFIPKERKGLPLKDMITAQRHLAYGLLSTAMSQRGFLTASTIMSLEQVLLEMEQGKGPKRDPENYFVSIFGKPEAQGTWSWRWEGHHMSLNFSIMEGRVIACTPSFMGTNPGEIRTGPRAGLKTLADEENLGRQLINALDASQQGIATYTNNAPADVISLAERKAKALSPVGITLDKLTSAQKPIFWQVVETYVRRARQEFADDYLKKLRMAPESALSFAWAGPMEPGKPQYYRIQGPSFLLEYDNTQNNANHVHAVWRDLEKDFGGDVLARHYEESHKQK